MSNNIVNKSLNPMKYIDQQQAKFVRRQKYSKRKRQKTLYCTTCCHRRCLAAIQPRNNNKSLKKQKGKNKRRYHIEYIVVAIYID